MNKLQQWVKPQKNNPCQAQIFISLELTPLPFVRPELSSFLHILGLYTTTVHSIITIGPSV